MRRLLLLAALPLAACGHGSADAPGVPGNGSGPARSFAVADFTGVESTGSDNVEITVGPRFAVRAEGDPAQLDKLRITRDGATLKVGREGFSFGSTRPIKIFVTMPRITDARTSGSGDIAIDRVDGDRFGGAIGGSGDLSIRSARVATLDLSITGSGDMAVAGQARSMKLDVSGSGDVDAQHLQVGEASVEVAGSGDVTADVRGPATVSLSGSGDIDLGDAARCTISKAGSGDVKCGR